MAARKPTPQSLKAALIALCPEAIGAIQRILESPITSDIIKLKAAEIVIKNAVPVADPKPDGNTNLDKLVEALLK